MCGRLSLKHDTSKPFPSLPSPSSIWSSVTYVHQASKVITWEPESQYMIWGYHRWETRTFFVGWSLDEICANFCFDFSLDNQGHGFARCGKCRSNHKSIYYIHNISTHLINSQTWFNVPIPEEWTSLHRAIFFVGKLKVCNCYVHFTKAYMWCIWH